MFEVSNAFYNYLKVESADLNIRLVLRSSVKIHKNMELYYRLWGLA
jgi:hypothetical protein